MAGCGRIYFRRSEGRGGIGSVRKAIFLGLHYLLLHLLLDMRPVDRVSFLVRGLPLQEGVSYAGALYVLHWTLHWLM